jgi:hypothetical protein
MPGIEVASQADMLALQTSVTALQADVDKLLAAPPGVGSPGPQGPAGLQGPAGKDGAQAADVVQELVVALKGVVSGGGTTTGTVTPPPGTGSGVGSSTDTNAYPFPIPADYKTGVLEVGTGPNRLEINLASNPNTGTPNTVAILVNGTAVLGPVTIASFSGMNLIGDNTFVLHGPWGSSPKVEIIGIAPNGIAGIFFNGATIDFQTLVANGAYGSGGFVFVNAPSLFNSFGSNMVITLPVPIAAPPVTSTATLTQINGQTLKQLLALATTPVTLSAGTIVGTGASEVSVAGAGIDKTIIDCTGVDPTFDKAAIVVTGAVTLSDMTIKGASISTGLGNNAAGVRNDQIGGAFVGFDLKNVRLSGNQNGILTDSTSTGTFNFDRLELDGNGFLGAGKTHQMYIGGAPHATMNLTNSKTIKGSIDAHEVKTRCGTNNLSGNVLVTGGNGSCVDASNGGILNIIGDNYTLPANAQDRNFITYAMENTLNTDIGHTVTIKDTVFNDLTGQGGFIQTKDPTATLNLVNCTYTGQFAPNLAGWGIINGAIAKAA